MKDLRGQSRVTIDNVEPQLNGGQFAVKRVVGERIYITADVFTDGHDKVKADILYRKLPSKKSRGKAGNWKVAPMEFLGNDRYEGWFTPDKTGDYEYSVRGYIDYYATWQYGLQKKYEDKQDIHVELLIGAEMLGKSKPYLSSKKQKTFEEWISLFKSGENRDKAVEIALSEQASDLMHEAYDHQKTKHYLRNLPLKVERTKALFSAWYEFFPRSASPEEGRHGRFKDCEKVLPEIARMGFDTVYFPPIHPIGRQFRKGRNNSLNATEEDPGSPWAIGSEEGGHKSIHPELGTMEDFTSLVAKANEHGIEIALDFAIQCSPDHPYVKEHPDWFTWRPDGTIQYAENPPKKYQDVLPLNFETDDWEHLWKELKSIVDFWIDKGVKIFRVDNPHTKPFSFWEWLIAEVHQKHPEVIFLAEAFTRPRVMERLAKVGFTQSYTYFTWRNTSEDFKEYLTELTRTSMREYFRPNFWPNTPDILPISLQHKHEPAFISRLVLAATLSSSYGIYGPVFEFGHNDPFPGKEEYIDNEKYEIKHWDWKKETKVKKVITALNIIRNENMALKSTWHVEFCECDNPKLLCYVRTDQEKDNKMLIAVNLDPDNAQAGWVQIPYEYLKLEHETPLLVHDLLNGSKYNWDKEWNYVELHPQVMPAHVFKVEHS